MSFAWCFTPDDSRDTNEDRPIRRVTAMKALMGTMAVTVALLLAGCSGVQTGGAGGSTTSTEQALCNQSRGGGFWIASAGVCARGGGG
jgi:hypothetical protein